MSRISLVEAYDNRDVIGQLVRLRKDVDELLNILKDIDPNGDLTNVVTKTGDQTIDGIKTFIGKIVANCDIIQNGAAYETHAEQVFSKNDYIVTRDEAIAGLAPGTYSGLHVKKYNGVDDARLVVDNEGIARVGDINDEQPLLTRDEVADMTSGNILSWDGVNKKAITSGKSVSDLNTDIAAKVSGTGNIGSDKKPVKIVAGEAVAVTDDVVITATNQDIDGNKTFLQPVYLGSATPGDDGKGYIMRMSDSTNQFTRIGTERDGTADYAELRVVINSGTGTAQLFLVKRVGGTTTQTAIASL